MRFGRSVISIISTYFQIIKRLRIDNEFLRESANGTNSIPIFVLKIDLALLESERRRRHGVFWFPSS